MRPLIVTEFITLDGVVESPGGEPTHPHAGWTMDHGSERLYAYKLQEVLDAGSLLFGRVTYQGFADAWSDRDGAFADRMNAMPKQVVTRSPHPLTWNATALTGDLAAAVGALKQADGGPILVAGSATLVRWLLANELVDELRLMTYPVAIGGGLSIWPTERGKLVDQHAETISFDAGVLLHVYRPDPGARAAPSDD
jgi:dihydrofolate reductase